MSLERNLEIIRTQGIEAKYVIEAIYEGLLDISQNEHNDSVRIEEMKQLMVLLRADATSVTPSGFEVVDSRNGFASLKLVIQHILDKQAALDAKVDAALPVRVSRTRTEVIPITTTYTYDPTKTPDQSTSTPGTAGILTISWQEERVNGVPTGRIFNETTTVTKAMVTRKDIVGTRSVATTNIRYVRVTAKRQGMNSGNFNEIEVFAGSTNIARSASVSTYRTDTITNPAYVIDGQRNLLSSVVNGTSPYIQLDLKSGRKDLTRMNILLYNSLTYDFVRVDVSIDGNTWRRIVNRTNYKENGQGVNIPMVTIYEGGTTYVDAKPEIGIGGQITLANPKSTPIYYDSGRAAAKLSSGNYIGTRATHTVYNIGYTSTVRPTSGNFITVYSNLFVIFSPKPTSGNYITLYGIKDVGWFRSDQIG